MIQVSLCVLKHRFSKQLYYLQAGEQRLMVGSKHPPGSRDQHVSLARGSA